MITGGRAANRPTMPLQLPVFTVVPVRVFVCIGELVYIQYRLQTHSTTYTSARLYTGVSMQPQHPPHLPVPTQQHLQTPIHQTFRQSPMLMQTYPMPCIINIYNISLPTACQSNNSRRAENGCNTFSSQQNNSLVNTNHKTTANNTNATANVNTTSKGHK